MDVTKIRSTNVYLGFPEIHAVALIPITIFVTYVETTNSWVDSSLLIFMLFFYFILI